MKKIILTVIVLILTVLNIFLFRDFYKKKENNEVSYNVEIDN